MATPEELVRVVRLDDGTVVEGRTRPGRGAWLCANSLSCLDVALRRKAFGRALRGEVTAAAVEGLRAELVNRARMEG